MEFSSSIYCVVSSQLTLVSAAGANPQWGRSLCSVLSWKIWRETVPLLKFMLICPYAQRCTRDLSRLLSPNVVQNWFWTAGKNRLFQRVWAGFCFLFHNLVGAPCGWNIYLDHGLEKLSLLYSYNGELLHERITRHEFYETDKKRTINLRSRKILYNEDGKWNGER